MQNQDSYSQTQLISLEPISCLPSYFNIDMKNLESMRDPIVKEVDQNYLQTQEDLRTTMAANTVELHSPETYLRNHYEEQDIISPMHDSYSFTCDFSAFFYDLNDNSGPKVPEESENSHANNTFSDVQNTQSEGEIPNDNNEGWSIIPQLYPSMQQMQDGPYIGLPQPEQPLAPNEEVKQDVIQPNSEQKRGPGRRRICNGFNQKKPQQSRTVFRAFCRILERDSTRRLLRKEFKDEERFDELMQHIKKGNYKYYKGRNEKESEKVNLALIIHKVTHASKVKSKFDFLKWDNFGKLFVLAQTYTRNELRVVQIKDVDNEAVERQELFEVLDYCLKKAQDEFSSKKQ